MWHFDGDYSDTPDEYCSESSDSDELEFDIPEFSLKHLEKWLRGLPKEKIFTRDKLDRGVWPDVLADDFKERFIPHQGCPIFFAR